MGNLILFKLHQTHDLWNLIILKSCGAPKHSWLHSQTLSFPPGHLRVGSGRARLGGGSQAGKEGKQKPLFPPKEQTFLPHFPCSTCIFWVRVCVCGCVCVCLVQAYHDPMLKLSIMTEQELNQIFGTLESLIPLHEGRRSIWTVFLHSSLILDNI